MTAQPKPSAGEHRNDRGRDAIREQVIDRIELARVGGDRESCNVVVPRDHK